MGSEMDESVNALVIAQPAIERNVGVPGRNRHIVIGGLAVGVRPAIRLQQDRDAARAQDRKVEMTVGESGINGRIAPRLLDVRLNRCGQDRQLPRVSR